MSHIYWSYKRYNSIYTQYTLVQNVQDEKKLFINSKLFPSCALLLIFPRRSGIFLLNDIKLQIFHFKVYCRRHFIILFLQVLQNLFAKSPHPHFAKKIWRLVSLYHYCFFVLLHAFFFSSKFARYLRYLGGVLRGCQVKRKPVPLEIIKRTSPSII